jgi:tRNA pseudouridine38-40 synthase
MACVDLSLSEGYQERHRVALLIEYDGTEFHGSQFQRHGSVELLTVQGSIQRAFSALNITLVKPIHLSSRTDAGVHARGQVVHVDLQADALKNIPSLQKALNAVLPSAIRILAVKLNIPVDFHSQNMATCRWYRYTMDLSPVKSAFLPPDVYWYHQDLNVETMQEACQFLLGHHHFRAFQCPDSAIENDVCTIFHASITRPSVNNIVFDVVSNRFLYKMVRNLMGALVFIGCPHYNYTPDWIRSLLLETKRVNTGTTLHPKGLCLMAVGYPEPYQFFCNSPTNEQLKHLLTTESLLT